LRDRAYYKTAMRMSRMARLVLTWREAESVRSALNQAVLMEKEKEREPASIRLWVAILLTIVALWFVDFLTKPVAHRRTSRIDAGQSGNRRRGRDRR
jgi:hypothetical protein